MSEMINIAEILKDCPKGTKLYSLIHGEVTLIRVEDNVYPIVVNVGLFGEECFTTDGRYINHHQDSECVLFPSKDQRDWMKFKIIKRFDPKTFEPFDKVLLRHDDTCYWKPGFFSHINQEGHVECILCSSIKMRVVPYNEDTKHLIYTANNCPEYYKWWED